MSLPGCRTFAKPCATDVHVIGEQKTQFVPVLALLAWFRAAMVSDIVRTFRARDPVSKAAPPPRRSAPQRTGPTHTMRRSKNGSVEVTRTLLLAAFLAGFLAELLAGSAMAQKAGPKLPPVPADADLVLWDAQSLQRSRQLLAAGVSRFVAARDATVRRAERLAKEPITPITANKTQARLHRADG